MAIYQSAVKCSNGEADRQIMCNVASKCVSFECFISFEKNNQSPRNLMILVFLTPTTTNTIFPTLLFQLGCDDDSIDRKSVFSGEEANGR